MRCIRLGRHHGWRPISTPTDRKILPPNTTSGTSRSPSVSPEADIRVVELTLVALGSCPARVYRVAGRILRQTLTLKAIGVLCGKKVGADLDAGRPSGGPLPRRTAARDARRARGQSIGRPKALDQSKVALAQRMHASGESASTLAATLGVSRATMYRALADITE